MSNLWLKMIGTSDRPCPDSYVREHVDFRGKKPRQIHPGDFMVLYAVGGEKRVFALATVTSEVHESGREGWPFRADIKYLANLSPSSGVLLSEVSTSNRNLLLSIRRRSHIKLSPKECARAVAKLRSKAGQS